MRERNKWRGREGREELQRDRERQIENKREIEMLRERRWGVGGREK
jgi:hypothetical protein